ncbi:hypothetical protein ACTK8Z_004628, partial [Yersinia enterocolitica]
MNNLEELFIANAELAAELLQHMADNEIDSDYFAVVTDSPNCGREVQSEHSVTEVALMAAGIIEQLIAQLEAKNIRADACVNAFEGIETERFAGKSIGEFLAGEVRLNKAEPKPDGSFGFTFSGLAIQIMAESFADQFKSSGAVNYLELLFDHSEVGPLTVTMQRVDGLTPAQKLATAEAALSAANEKLLVPGVLCCAKCSFQLAKTNLYMASGTTGPGDNKTEPCPNGCGPLWPVTWEQWSREIGVQLDRYFDEAKELREKLANPVVLNTSDVMSRNYITKAIKA